MKTLPETCLPPLALDLATSAAVVTVAAEPVDAVLTRFLDMGETGGGGGDRLIREAASSRSSLKHNGQSDWSGTWN